MLVLLICMKLVLTISGKLHGEQHGDMVFFQGHSSPGIWRTKFLLKDVLVKIGLVIPPRVSPVGLSSYPSPMVNARLLVSNGSMGLIPLMAIYQARFMYYLDDRNQTPGT